MRLFNVFNKRNKNNYFIELIDTNDECKKIVLNLIENLKQFHYMEKKHLRDLIQRKLLIIL